jgi:hypothetical protein
VGRFPVVEGLVAILDRSIEGRHHGGGEEDIEGGDGLDAKDAGFPVERIGCQDIKRSCEQRSWSWVSRTSSVHGGGHAVLPAADR